MEKGGAAEAELAKEGTSETLQDGAGTSKRIPRRSRGWKVAKGATMATIT